MPFPETIVRSEWETDPRAMHALHVPTGVVYALTEAQYAEVMGVPEDSPTDATQDSPDVPSNDADVPTTDPNTPEGGAN